MFNILKLRLAPIGCITNMAAYVIIFLGLPNSSALSFTDEEPFIELPWEMKFQFYNQQLTHNKNKFLAGFLFYRIVWFLLAEIFNGMGDACLHIEAYSFLGQLYPSDSPAAFAVFKFTRVWKFLLLENEKYFLTSTLITLPFQGIGICIGFYLGRFLGLHVQTVILFTSSFVATIVYYYNWQLSEPDSANWFLFLSLLFYFIFSLYLEKKIKGKKVVSCINLIYFYYSLTVTDSQIPEFF